MSIMDIVRRRFTSELQSHQIDEDYTFPTRTGSTSIPSSIPGSGTHTPGNSHSVDRSIGFDPNEDVPSYETSQMMYEHQQTHHIQHSQPVHPLQYQQTDHSVLSSRNNSVISNENPLTAVSSNSSTSSIIATTTPVAVPSNSESVRNGIERSSIKQLGLKFLNARQHFALAVCRDVSLFPAIFGLIQSWGRVFWNNEQVSIETMSSMSDHTQHLNQSLTSGRLSEHFLTGMWCIVSAYLSYSALDSLIIRWIVTYSTPAAIVRVLSMSTIMVTIELYLVSTFSADGYKYGLHIWILISCCLTLTYIGQNFVTSNLDLKKGIAKRARFFDIYNIVVFAVVPVGLASFITMIGLLRSLLILRIDIDQSGIPLQ